MKVKLNGVEWKKLDSRIFEEKFDVLIVNRGDKFLDFKKNVKKEFFGYIIPLNIF